MRGKNSTILKKTKPSDYFSLDTFNTSFTYWL